MRRKLALILSLCALLLLATLTFWRWQMHKLDSSFRSLPVHSIQTSSLASLATIALDSSVLAGLDARDDQPIMEKYKREPEVVERQAKFVATWINANNAIRYLRQTSISPGKMVSLSELKQIPAQYQTDGWNQPFCGFADDDTAVLMTSGGNGVLACQSLQQAAAVAKQTINTKKLTKLNKNIFVIVRRNWKSDEDRGEAKESDSFSVRKSGHIRS